MTTRRERILRYCWREGRRFQFGQEDDSRFWINGKNTGCGGASVQLIAGIHGHDITLNDVAKAVGYPNARQTRLGIGLYERQVPQALAHWDIEYEIRSDLTTRDLIEIATHKGPIIMEYIYGTTPEWFGYQYGSVHADGKPNGYARPKGKAGKTQLTGFEDGRHYSVILSAEAETSEPRPRVWFRDTNHDSVRRPERPPYDVISEHQLDVMYHSFRKAEGRLWACIPTKALPNR